jgi:glycosyltransferase involved in cell wall biosynthesis
MSSEARRLLSVVIPVYDSPSLEALTDGIEEVFQRRGDDYEIIFVDDGSPDAAIWPVLERLARDRIHVRAIQLTRNFGQAAATLCGFQEARGEVVITLDDDLQHDPADIPLLLAEAQHDIVIAQFERKEHGLFRRVASRAKGLFDEIVVGKPKGLQLSSFRLLSRTVVDGIMATRTPRPFLPALMFHVSRDVVGVPVRHGRRAGGRSGYTPAKLLGLFSNLLINNSSLLLRVVALTGFAFAAIAFVMAGVVIFQRLANRITVKGWTSLLAAILLTSGLLLISVGIVGEYLIRIIETSEAKATFHVRRRSG